jgi:hypothetical protein
MASANATLWAHRFGFTRVGLRMWVYEYRSQAARSPCQRVMLAKAKGLNSRSTEALRASTALVNTAAHRCFAAAQHDRRVGHE